jgi:hypothetical protein
LTAGTFSGLYGTEELSSMKLPPAEDVSNKTAVSQLSLSSWCDAKLLLETFAWAGRLQDKSGQELWDEAMRLQSDLRE